MRQFDIFDIVQAIWQFSQRERGQALAEYALILGFIAVVCVVALTTIGLAISGSLGSFAGAFGGGGGSP
jgi:Flp pilus assembly pilin Flp